MLIGPVAIRLLCIEYAIGNLILSSIVEVNVTRTNPQRSAENTELVF